MKTIILAALVGSAFTLSTVAAFANDHKDEKHDKKDDKHDKKDDKHDKKAEHK